MVQPSCGVCLQDETTNQCPLCERCIELAQERNWAPDLDFDIHKQMAQVLGGPIRSLKRRWEHLEQFMLNTPDVDWARLANPQEDPVRYSPFPEEEEEIFIEKLISGNGVSGYEKEKLEDGYLMRNGSIISFNDGRMFVDGQRHNVQIPIRQFLILLTDKENRIGWDIVSIFLAVSALYQPIRKSGEDGRYMNRYYNLFFRNNRQNRITPFDSMMQTSYLLCEQKRKLGHNPLVNPHWARNLLERLDGRRPRQRMKLSRRFLRDGSNNLLQDVEWPWARRWANLTDLIEHKNVPSPIMLSTKGELCFRAMTKKGSTRRTPIPPRPGLLACLVSWCSSPHESREGEMLIATQMNWSSAYEQKEKLSPPLVKSMQFLRGVLNQFPNDTWVEDDRILVRGMIGHFYEIRLEQGAHMAPFKIHGVRLGSTSPQSLCIHTGRYHRDIPIGDTIAIVVLSLISDAITAEKVNSLMMYLRTNEPVGDPQSTSRLTPKAFYSGARGRLPDFMMFGGPQPFDNMVTTVEVDGGQTVSDSVLVKDWRVRPQAISDSIFDFDAADFHGIDLPQFEWRNRQRGGQRLVMDEPQVEVVDVLEDVAEEPAEPLREQDGQFHRWYRTMPLVWEALSLQPIGNHVSVGGVRGVLRLQGCGLRITIRTAQEEDAILRFLEILGYHYSRRLNGDQVFIRRDFPIANPRQELRNILNPLEQELGFFNIENYVLRYLEVGRPPDRMPEVDRRLHANLVDHY